MLDRPGGGAWGVVPMTGRRAGSGAVVARILGRSDPHTPATQELP